jgi:hypothetical protein
MPKRVFHTFIAISLLFCFITVTPSLNGEILLKGHNSQARIERPCDMVHCDMDHSSPNTPKCPLCPTFNSFAFYLCNGVRIDLPTFTSSFALVSVDALSDQGVVKTIFHPPTSIL